jgi:hypothetical protein
MKPFHVVAVPDKDILEGKLTLDVFAADLWEVYLRRGRPEYKDPELFFKKTYLTSGLKNLLDVVENRLRHGKGDSVIQIQTPFGGGKTHALIALFHRAEQWRAKRLVFVGTKLNPNEETPWGLFEKQLTGTRKSLTGKVAPGSEALRRLLEKHQPVLILMDEILEYTTKAAGVNVAESTLAAQVLSFMQELTEVVRSLDNTCLVMTLPSSALEHYDESSEKLFQQLQKISGRVQRIYTPVLENEVSKVIRSRLFSSFDEKEARKVISDFIKYAEREQILPPETEPTSYKDRFIESYPFIPEVIDILYHRWGSFPSFQRTRGVLRLLALVLYSLRNNNLQYITLSDFDLSDQQIRRELLEYTGNEFDSIIAADITSADSGSKKVDASLGKSYRGLSIGTRAATAIFLHSFSGAQEKGANIGEIKRHATILDIPSSVVAEAVEQLKTKLSYLQSRDNVYYFTNTPNLNRIIQIKMENVSEQLLKEKEMGTIRSQLSGKNLKVFLWPEKAKDVPDTSDLKLIILQDKNEKFIEETLQSKGDTPRVYRNTLFFICPLETEKSVFVNLLKKLIVYEQISNDKTIYLTEEQRRDISNRVRRDNSEINDILKRCYRLVYVPAKDGYKKVDLGVPTFGEEKRLDDYVYDRLREEEEILERLSPLVLKNRYLEEREYAKTRAIYDSMLRTPGEIRLASRKALEDCIVQGVRQGLFGLGEMEDTGSIKCNYFKEDAQISFDDYEVILRSDLCLSTGTKGEQEPVGVGETATGSVEPEPREESPRPEKQMNSVNFEFEIPKGKVSQILQMMNFLQNKFERVKISVSASEGSISKEDYENKIKETLRQIGVRDIEDKNSDEI